MTAQDRDVLVVCLIGGTGLLAALTGITWAVAGLLTLTRPRQGA